MRFQSRGKQAESSYDKRVFRRWGRRAFNQPILQKNCHEFVAYESIIDEPRPALPDSQHSTQQQPQQQPQQPQQHRRNNNNHKHSNISKQQQRQQQSAWRSIWPVHARWSSARWAC